MRIALRTGGGRGVYELAGRQGQMNASDLFDREIFYELTPSLVIPGRAMASLLQGKPRIRLEDRLRTTHLYRLLAAVLLLPKPKREFKKTHGGELLKFEAYSMTAIKVDIADIAEGSVTLRPTDLLLENADHLHSEVQFAQRMSRIARLWDAASVQDTPLAQLIRNLQSAVLAEDPDYKVVESRAQDISDLLGTEGDPLPLAEQQLGLGEGQQEALPKKPSQFTHQADFGIEDDTSPDAARIERIKQWRMQAVRGSAGYKFRREVSAAYEYRCLFTGQRLPKLEVTESAGVDSAHILPWSTHDIDSVRNGVCLNKQCHWAFDEGVLRLTFDAGAGTYVVDVPDPVRKAAKKASFDLQYFEALTGPISGSRLPKNKALWPSPTYIEELNRFVFST
jgi:putative restriction endonuclease